MTRLEPSHHDAREQLLADALEVVARRLEGARLTREEAAALEAWENDAEFRELVALLKTARREMKGRAVAPDLATLRRMEETVLMTARRTDAAPLSSLRLAAGPLPAGTDSELAQSLYASVEDPSSDVEGTPRPVSAVDTPSRQIRSDCAVLHCNVITSEGEPQPLELKLYEAVLGRGEVPIHIDGDGQVSRRHARLLLLDGNVVVSDLDSRNGTHVNGRRITDPEPLAIDDTVEIGNTSLILDEIESEAPGYVCATFSSQHGDRYVVDLSEIVIGRASTATVIIEDPTRRMSRRHARIDLCDGQFLITDLGSTNGVAHEEALITGSAVMEPDLEFELGGIKLRVVAMMRP